MHCGVPKMWRLIGCALLIACLSAISPVSTAERLFFEAEEMSADKAWKPVAHFEGWYSGAPSGGKTLWGSENGSQGEARKTLRVAGGNYLLWFRYLDGRYRAPFTVQVKQAGAVLAEKTIDRESLRETKEGKAKWGDGYSVFVWQSIPLAVTAGEVEIVVLKAEPLVCSWITRYLDCFVLSDDPGYIPDIADFFTPLYLKVKAGPGQRDPCIIHFFGRRPRAPWFVAHSNIYKDHIASVEAFPNPRFDAGGANPAYLASGEESIWVNIAPFLDPIGDNHVDFFATQAYYPGLSAADFSLILSKTPSNDGIFKTFHRAGSGGSMSLIIDLNDRKAIKSDLEYSGEAAAIAAKLPPAPGKRPRRFPVMTGNVATSGAYQAATIQNELKVMAALGFSSTGEYDPMYFANGCRYYFSGSPSFHLTRGGCLSTPDTPAIQALARQQAQVEIARGLLQNIVAWNQMDEPGSVTMAHMTSCPACTARFRDYLKGRGGQPRSFHKASWDEISPTTDSEGQPELYYFTALCRAQIITDFFKIGTDALREKIPDVRTMANFGEDLTWHGNALAYGVDWFQVQAQDALRYGWTENGMAFATSAQLGGYRTDFLRAASTQAGHGFGVYAMLRPAWDLSALVTALVGHGAQAVFYYNYGPYYSASTDQGSLNYALYPAMRATNYAIGAVEDYLIDARVPKSKIGLLYSPTTDIWSLNEEYSISGKERMGLYLLLRHLGYPVEFVTEDEIMSGKIAGYRAIFVTGSHLQRAALAPLADWVRGGGFLYAGAGSLLRDEFNRPLDADGLLGLARQPFVLKDRPGRETLETWALPALTAVAWQGTKLEAICGMQPWKGEAGTLASFGDGSPAVSMSALGKGRVAFCGFFPGLAYEKSGVVALKALEVEMQKTGKTPVTANPPEYARGYRDFFATLVREIAWQPPVTTSHYLVEADLLEGPKGCVIALSNWTGAPLQQVRVTLRVKGHPGKPFAAINPVKTLIGKNGVVQLTLNLGAGDFIVVPYAK